MHFANNEYLLKENIKLKTQKRKYTLTKNTHENLIKMILSSLGSLFKSNLKCRKTLCGFYGIGL